MSLTIGNYVKGLYLLSFIVSSIISYINPTVQSGLIAGLSVLGFISHDVLSFFRERNPKKDFEPDIKALVERCSKLETEIQDMKNDHSLAHIAATFKRK